jgi:hypothetical protein
MAVIEIDDAAQIDSGKTPQPVYPASLKSSATRPNDKVNGVHYESSFEITIKKTPHDSE